LKDKIDRFFQYNISRIRQAEHFDIHHANFFFKIVPFLLHNNCPELPGFVENSPCGIYRFSPQKLISPSLLEYYFPAAPALDTYPQQAGYCIHSLKTIGSIGTIAQSAQSDCDYWVSIDCNVLTSDAVNKLQQKCELIEEWAKIQRIEIHFFLMDITATRENRFDTSAEEESAGSSLKLLLKDELFRTHILIAGKIPLWWLIPPGLTDKAYKTYAEKLLRENPFIAQHFIDLGYITNIPKEEIFGACLWQMNKALDSPFKSVIKFAYLELLLQRRSNTLPLFSDRIKCLVTFPEKITSPVDKKLTIDEIDPYLMLASDISSFYQQTNDQQRSTLIQKCLLLKTLEGISEKNTDSTADKAILELMQKWHLLPESFQELLKADYWSYQNQIIIGNEVHNFLLATYKRLRAVFKQFKTKSNVTITERDITVLGRKLFTFYEKKENKVPFLKSISRELMGQDDITIQILNTARGTVYCALQGDLAQKDKRADHGTLIHKETELVPLIFWLILNGILTPKSNIHLTRNFHSFSLTDLQELTKVMRSSLPITAFTHISADQLLKPEKILRALIIVNLDKEPVKGNKHLVSQIISMNSFGEYFIHTYSTLTQLKNAINTLLTKHYVSRWNNNLFYHIPSQPEKKHIASLLGI